MPVEPETLTFYKSKVTEKWWLEVAYHQPGARYQRNSIIPCSYTDYQTATKGEIPERYISTLAKLI
jgi:formiminoglutamase